MKVVLFCGGQGLRLRELSETIPKPMVTIGYRPILWHVMRYYAHFGHKEFILCLGYKADVIKEYFLRYNAALSNDFVLTGAGRSGGTVELLAPDIEDWQIRFIDTGLQANIGQRLKAIQPYLGDDEMFLANYGDVVTDAPLDELTADFAAKGKVAGFLSILPTNYSFHFVHFKGDGLVSRIEDVETSDIWINGGHFMFRREIFDYMEPGEELVVEPFRRLIRADELMAYRYRGFWAPMDTLKDVHMLESLWQSGIPPWAVWQNRSAP
jgi:glucose-1-phosphate cytidylyltransferase